MPQDLAHRVEFRTRGDGQCRSRVAAAMIGQFLTCYASLVPDTANVLCHPARFFRQMKHVLSIISRTWRQHGEGQSVQRHRHRTARLVLDYGHRPAISPRFDVAPPETLHVSQPEFRHAGEAEGSLNLTLCLCRRLHSEEPLLFIRGQVFTVLVSDMEAFQLVQSPQLVVPDLAFTEGLVEYGVDCWKILSKVTQSWSS